MRQTPPRRWSGDRTMKQIAGRWDDYRYINEGGYIPQTPKPAATVSIMEDSEAKAVEYIQQMLTTNRAPAEIIAAVHVYRFDSPEWNAKRKTLPDDSLGYVLGNLTGRI